ncbi:hypothetical protein ACJJTC_007896 [Scirpophaga incertulas]
MYVVVQFEDKDQGGGLGLVLSKWITPRKSEVFWPPVKEQYKFDKLLKQNEEPDREKWATYGIKPGCGCGTQMECDSVHAAIERKLKNREIHIPSDFISVTLEAGKNPTPYEAIHVDYSLVKDFSDKST